MRLILTRHGQSDGNVKRTISGFSESALTDLGRKQATLLANRLADENIIAAFSSDLSRASDTAREVLKFHSKVRLEETTLLRERNFGIYEQQPLRHFLADLDSFNGTYWEFQPVNGETLPELEVRATDFLSQLTGSYAEKTILVCGHHSINKMLLHCLLKRNQTDWMGFTQGNTCVNIIEVSSHTAREVLMNCTAHLDG